MNNHFDDHEDDKPHATPLDTIVTACRVVAVGTLLSVLVLAFWF